MSLINLVCVCERVSEWVSEWVFRFVYVFESVYSTGMCVCGPIGSFHAVARLMVR
jgi:hypothetical protein